MKPKRAPSVRKKTEQTALPAETSDKELLKENNVPEPEPLTSKKASIEAVGKHQEEVKQVLTQKLDEEIKEVRRS